MAVGTSNHVTEFGVRVSLTLAVANTFHIYRENTYTVDWDEVFDTSNLTDEMKLQGVKNKERGKQIFLSSSPIFSRFEMIGSDQICNCKLSIPWWFWCKESSVLRLVSKVCVHSHRGCTYPSLAHSSVVTFQNFHFNNCFFDTFHIFSSL